MVIKPSLHMNSPDQTIINGNEQEKFVEHLNQRLIYDREKRKRTRDYATILKQYNTPKYVYTPPKSIYYYDHTVQKQRKLADQRPPFPSQKVLPPSPVRIQKLPLTPRTDYWLGLCQPSIHLKERGKDKTNSISTKTTKDPSSTTPPPLVTQHLVSDLNSNGEENQSRNDFSHHASSSSVVDRILTTSNLNHKPKTFNRLPLVKSNNKINITNINNTSVSYYTPSSSRVPSIVRPDSLFDCQTLIADGKKVLDTRSHENMRQQQIMKNKKQIVVPS
ncbi:unnamed protein product [Didymodactylos carnosus]|uniref:Uncharacterized protein n=1 Tax=Didymodactylos carnosus TaxID=1234261 RepID=A0A814L615_9BILA|nr:unnamed protein product [Didymodactylos carnosus]CAF3828915.1 unnamed protein product [Didymodactylos carnosus]